MVMGFLFSLLGCSGKGQDDTGRSRFWTEKAHRENLAKQVAMTPQTMAQLRKLGAAEDSMLRLEFFFYTDTEQKAGLLAAALRKLGYDVTAGRSAGDEKLFLVTGWTTPLRMEDAIVVEWAKQMCRLGYEYDCEFDGWGTNPGQAPDQDREGKGP